MAKFKKHTDADRLRYMHMLEKGRSARSISIEFGITYNVLSVLWKKYQLYGVLGIKKEKNFYVDAAKKKEIIRDIEENHITLSAASLKYGPSAKIIEKWLYIARHEGIDALDTVRKRGRPPVMGRPRKDSKPLTELERLRKENLELRTEIAMLKKVRALVEERNARLREIGRGPSKN